MNTQTLIHFLEKLSPRQKYYDLKAKLPTQHLLSSIDKHEFRQLLKFKDNTGHPQYKKYFNTPYWLHLNVKRALYLGLNRSKPISILDIGCGFGYFPYAARFYGHDVKAIDVPGDVLFQKVSEFLDVQRYNFIIQEFKPFIDLGTKFDLVTAFQVCFNNHTEGHPWGCDKWEYFLEDLFANHMNTGGRIYLEFNWSPHVHGWMSAEVKELFKTRYKAKFDGQSRVWLHAPGSI
jgi:SAM-dependent methyltransferase